MPADRKQPKMLATIADLSPAAPPAPAPLPITEKAGDLIHHIAIERLTRMMQMASIELANLEAQAALRPEARPALAAAERMVRWAEHEANPATRAELLLYAEELIQQAVQTRHLMQLSRAINEA